MAQRSNLTDAEHDKLCLMAASLLATGGFSHRQMVPHLIRIQVEMNIPADRMRTFAGDNSASAWIAKYRTKINGYIESINAGRIEPLSIEDPKKPSAVRIVRYPLANSGTYGMKQHVSINAPTQLPIPKLPSFTAPEEETSETVNESPTQPVHVQAEIDYDLLADKVYQRFMPGLSRIADAIIDAMPKFDQSKLISKDDVLELIALLDAQATPQVAVVGDNVAQSATPATLTEALKPGEVLKEDGPVIRVQKPDASAGASDAGSDENEDGDADHDPLEHQPPAYYQEKEAPKHPTLLVHELNKPKPIKPISIVVYGLQTQQEDRIEKAYKNDDVVKLIFVRDANRLKPALEKADTAVAMSSYMTQQARQQLHDREKLDRSFKYHTINGSGSAVQRTISELVEQYKLANLRTTVAARH